MSTAPQVALIDDDLAWLDSLAEYLGARGLSVHTAADGLQGLALLEAEDIPVAVVDFNMPGLDGLELLRRLRQRRRPVAVLLVSGDDDPSLPGRVRAEGGQGFLSKTASPRLLLTAVRQALAGRRPRPPDQPWNRLLPRPRGGAFTSSEPGTPV